MKKQRMCKTSFALLILALTLTLMGQAFSAAAAMPNSSTNSKVLIVGRAIATWPSGIPAGEKRPVVVFLPGWGGVGAVDASVSAQNTNLVNEGYVTLAVGFDSGAAWTSDINVKTAQGLDLLCADASIPANCNAIVLDGESYGGSQNYWVMEYLRSHGYAGGAGSKALGFVSEDAGYAPPGNITDYVTGAFTRTGLADTASYSVAMIENLGDTTFPVDDCTWGNCGARELSNAHLARGDNNVFSICPSGGEHGTRGFANWNIWVISAIKTIIHITNGIPAFTGYTNPTLTVSNTCVNTTPLHGLSVSGINIVANGQAVRLRGVNMGDPFWARNPAFYPMYSIADYATLSQNWHANVVRISIFPTQWKSMDQATLLAGLAQEVNAALGNGMYVIISYHVIGWPDGWYQPAYAGNPVDTYDSSMLVATSFWTQMAKTYGADTRIIFDLWNEPVNPDDFNLGVTDPNQLWPALKAFYESLIQTVRTNGGQNIVIAAGNRWASWLVSIKDNPLADPNVVYAYHKYSVEGANTATEWNKDTGGLIGIKPVIVSEWGYEDSDVVNPTWPGSQASYGDPFTQWMASNHLSNLAWMYHHDWTPALLKADGSLTLYGTFVKHELQQTSETISTPTTPSGSISGSPGTSYSYSTGGSTSSLGHSIEYQFDWNGNGSSDLSSWGSSPQSKTWNTNGTYSVRARARCSQDTSIVSSWSGTLTVTITGTGSIFSDVPTSHWAYNYILAIYNAHITTGCSQNPLKYCPEDNVTREQMAAFIVRAKEGEPAANYCDTGVPFTDVTSTMWSCRYIKRLKELGVTTGYGDGRYGALDTVTREQMAAFIIRAREGEPAANYCSMGSSFPDVDSNSWACKYIKRLKELGVTTGYGDGRYGPLDLVTRAQMAAFLARAFLGMP